MSLKKKKYTYIAITGLLAAAVGAFLFWASWDVDSGIYMKCLCRGTGSGHCVSITFDDGPDEVMTPKVLDILKENNIKASFFVIGSKAEKHPEIISRIIDEGHIIGGHSWSHACDFPLQSSKAIYDELSDCEELLYDITQRRIALFRPPFGVTNPLIAKAVEEKDCINIGWSIRSYDPCENTDRKDVLKRIVSQLHDGAVILLHDRSDKADELLAMLISALRENEYDILGLDEMLGIEPYRNSVL